MGSATQSAMGPHAPRHGSEEVMLHLEKSVWKTASAFGGVWLGLMIVPSLAQTRSSAEQPPGAGAGAGVVATAPAGQVNRYVIPNYTSQSLAATRSIAAVTIMNNTGAPCNAAVAFQFASATTDTCVITLSIPARQSRIFCSRPIGDPVVPCQISCNPPLTFNTGHAFVSSTIGNRCARISVDAQQYFLRDANDDFVKSQSRLTVTTLTGSQGD